MLGDYQYMEIQEWWKTQKSGLRRGKDDIPPINYEKEYLEANG